MAILETGLRTATYKLATVTALIDHCIENLPADVDASLDVPIGDLAHRVIALCAASGAGRSGLSTSTPRELMLALPYRAVITALAVCAVRAPPCRLIDVAEPLEMT